MILSKELYDKLPVRHISPPNDTIIEYFAKKFSLNTEYAKFINLQNGLKTALLNGVYKNPQYAGINVKLEKAEIEGITPEKERELSQEIGLKAPVINSPGISM